MPSSEASSRSAESEHEDMAVKRSTTLWMDDGNIVLQAGSTQFRVHKSMLARHSPIFNDLFLIPQPPEDQPTIDGCPIVHLSDSAQDLHLILTMLYDNRVTYNVRKEVAFPFTLIAAMLRIGRKYEITHFREEAISRVAEIFPTSSLAAYRSAAAVEDRLLVDFLILSWENSVNTVLPILLFNCLKFSLKELLTGITCDKAQSAVQLPLALQRIIITGREEIIKQLLRHTFAYLRQGSKIIPSDECESPRQCIKERMELANNLWMPQPNPSLALESWSYRLFGKTFCQSCAVAAKASHIAGYKAMWQNLPLYFGLPPWKELKNFE